MKKSKSHLDSNSEEEDDEVDELEIKKVSNSKKNRSSVSAEAYGKFNKKENFVARVIEKTQE
jgi:cAMP-dependent protein kinase regulator